MLGSQGIVVKCTAAIFFPTVDYYSTQMKTVLNPLFGDVLVAFVIMVFLSSLMIFILIERRQQKRHQTKRLISGTMALRERSKSWLSLQQVQQSEIIVNSVEWL